MQALRKPNPSAVTAANPVTRKRTAGRNTHTKPHLSTPWKLQEHSWMRSYSCEDKMPYVMQGIDEAYYCVPTIENG